MRFQISERPAKYKSMRNHNRAFICPCGCFVAAFALFVNGGNLWAQNIATTNAAASTPPARGGFGGGNVSCGQTCCGSWSRAPHPTRCSRAGLRLEFQRNFFAASITRGELPAKIASNNLRFHDLNIPSWCFIVQLARRLPPAHFWQGFGCDRTLYFH